MLRQSDAGYKLSSRSLRRPAGGAVIPYRAARPGRGAEGARQPGFVRSVLAVVLRLALPLGMSLEGSISTWRCDATPTRRDGTSNAAWARNHPNPTRRASCDDSTPNGTKVEKRLPLRARSSKRRTVLHTAHVWRQQTYRSSRYSHVPSLARPKPNRQHGRDGAGRPRRPRRAPRRPGRAARGAETGRAGGNG